MLDKQKQKSLLLLIIAALGFCLVNSCILKQLFIRRPNLLDQKRFGLDSIKKDLIKLTNKSLVKPLVHRGKGSHQSCSVRKGVPRNFTKMTGKHLYHSLIFTEHLWATALEGGLNDLRFTTWIKRIQVF